MDRGIDVSGNLEGPLRDSGWCRGGQDEGRQKSDKENDPEGCHVELMLTGSQDEKEGKWSVE